MELLLNLVWLGLAIGMVGLWWARWLPAIRRGERLHSAVALCCFLALMFYVISMTDDLHEEIVFMGEATSARNALHATHSPASDHSVTAHYSPPAVVRAAPTDLHCLAAGRVAVEPGALPLESLRIMLPERAPPQSSMSSL